MADQQHRYRAENPASIAVHPFDELTLLYHRRSGITHMVIAPAPQILAVMGSEELAVADILHRLSQDFDLGTRGQERSEERRGGKEWVSTCRYGCRRFP